MKKINKQLSSIIPLIALPQFLYILFLLFIPFTGLVIYSFWTSDFFEIDRTFTLFNYYFILFEEHLYLFLIFKSLFIGLMVAFVTIPIAFILSYILTFKFEKISNLLLGIVMVSTLSSYLIRIYAWKIILGEQGIINKFFLFLGIINQPFTFLLYGNFSIIITLVHILLPFAFLPIYSSMQNIDKQIVEASRDLGFGFLMTIFKVIIPLSFPGIVAAFLFCFILSSADYVTPQLVGGADGVMIGRVIYDQFGHIGDPPLGSSIAVILLILFSFLFFLIFIIYKIYKILKTKIRFLFLYNKIYKNNYFSYFLSRIPFGYIFLFLIIVFLYTPLFVIIILSFSSAKFASFPIEEFSLHWYFELFKDNVFHESLVASLIVGFIAVVGTFLLAMPTSFIFVRKKFFLKKIFFLISLAPLFIPGIIIGISWIAGMGILNLRSGLYIVSFAHVLFCIPFFILIMRSRLMNFDLSIEEAARDLGSNPSRVLRTITFPIILPSIIGACILVFAVSLDEFIITNLVIGANSTIPTYIWGMMRYGLTPTANSLSSIMIIISVFLVIFSSLIMKNQKTNIFAN